MTSMSFVSFRFVSRHGSAHASQRHKDKDQLHTREFRLRVSEPGRIHGGIALLAMVTTHGALTVRRRGNASESLSLSRTEQ